MVQMLTHFPFDFITTSCSKSIVSADSLYYHRRKTPSGAHFVTLNAFSSKKLIISLFHVKTFFFFFCLKRTKAKPFQHSTNLSFRRFVLCFGCNLNTLIDKYHFQRTFSRYFCICMAVGIHFHLGCMNT